MISVIEKYISLHVLIWICGEARIKRKTFLMFTRATLSARTYWILHTEYAVFSIFELFFGCLKVQWLFSLRIESCSYKLERTHLTHRDVLPPILD